MHPQQEAFQKMASSQTADIDATVDISEVSAPPLVPPSLKETIEEAEPFSTLAPNLPPELLDLPYPSAFDSAVASISEFLTSIPSHDEQDQDRADGIDTGKASRLKSLLQMFLTDSQKIISLPRQGGPAHASTQSVCDAMQNSHAADISIQALANEAMHLESTYRGYKLNDLCKDDAGLLSMYMDARLRNTIYLNSLRRARNGSTKAYRSIVSMNRRMLSGASPLLRVRVESGALRKGSESMHGVNDTANIADVPGANLRVSDLDTPGYALLCSGGPAANIVVSPNEVYGAILQPKMFFSTVTSIVSDYAVHLQKKRESLCAFLEMVREASLGCSINSMASVLDSLLRSLPFTGFLRFYFETRYGPAYLSRLNALLHSSNLYFSIMDGSAPPEQRVRKTSLAVVSQMAVSKFLFATLGAFFGAEQSVHSSVASPVPGVRTGLVFSTERELAVHIKSTVARNIEAIDKATHFVATYESYAKTVPSIVDKILIATVSLAHPKIVESEAIKSVSDMRSFGIDQKYIDLFFATMDDCAAFGRPLLTEWIRLGKECATSPYTDDAIHVADLTNIVVLKELLPFSTS